RRRSRGGRARGSSCPGRPARGHRRHRRRADGGGALPSGPGPHRRPGRGAGRRRGTGRRVSRRAAAVSSVPVRLRGLLGQLSPATRRVAAHVLADPHAAAQSTITELAEQTGTSQSTIVRLCHETGLAGYREFRLALAADVARSDAETPTGITSDISPDDELATVVAKIAVADTRAVNQTAQALSVPDLEAVVVAVARARQIGIYEIGRAHV